MNPAQDSQVTSCLPIVWHQQLSRHRDAPQPGISTTHMQDIQFRAQAATTKTQRLSALDLDLPTIMLQDFTFPSTGSSGFVLESVVCHIW